MTIITTLKERSRVKIVKSEYKPIFFDNREIAEIDFTETTAIKEFCKIRFKDSNEFYFIQSYRLNINPEDKIKDL